MDQDVRTASDRALGCDLHARQGERGRPFSEHQCIGVALAAPDPEHWIVGTRPLVEAFRDRRDKRLALESFDFAPAHREQEGLYPPP